VIAPLTPHFDDFTWSRIDNVPDDRYQLSPAINFYLGNGIARFLAGERDSLNLALEVCEIIGRH
jgi:hypothetical protein